MRPLARYFRQFLRRGESSVALIGLGVLSILLVGTAMSMWWAAGAERSSIRSGRHNQLASLANVLQDTIPPLVAHHDMAALRRVLVNAKYANDLVQCRVLLPDGRIVADAEPARINVESLPEKWSAAPLAGPPAGDANSEALQFPVTVGGRGVLVLELAGAVRYPPAATSDMQMGMSVIGMAGMGAAWMVYRRLRTRTQVLGMIQEALVTAGSGVRDPQALTIQADKRPEVESWNRLILEHNEMRHQKILDRTRELLDAGGDRGLELEAACDALGAGLVLVNAEGVVLYANGAAAVFLNTARDALAGTPAEAHFKDERVRAAIGQAVKANEPQRRVLECQTREGESLTVLRYDIRPLRRRDGHAVMITIDDLTQQRVADLSRNAFVAQVSHELRNPLTTIRLYLETAAVEGEKDPAIRAKCLNVITQESSRLERVVAEMLSISEIEAGSMQLNVDDVRLDALFGGLKTEYEAQARAKNIQLAFEMPPKYPVIPADRERLALALHNLIGNAIKYTPTGGTVQVALKPEPRQIVIEVSDSGIGIDEKEHELVFDRFYRAKDPRVLKITGSGLGLALAREIVRLHKGDITLQSQLNKGSTFTVTLPLATETR